MVVWENPSKPPVSGVLRPTCLARTSITRSELNHLSSPLWFSGCLKHIYFPKFIEFHWVCSAWRAFICIYSKQTPTRTTNDKSTGTKIWAVFLQILVIHVKIVWLVIGSSLITCDFYFCVFFQETAWQCDLQQCNQNYMILFIHL